MAVRTARLAFGQTGSAGVTSTLYTCPAGKTAIVKDLRLSQSGASSVSTILATSSGAKFCNLLIDTIPVNGTRVFQGFIVLEPGDSIVINASTAGGVIYHVSGSELAGVAP
uniref:Uncharacterized protein n=1 Tax=uncultured prokaryote TaxID=198431 RepID=A0A0H5PV10_9ZZZZ|nr:hypothetical protein [uncultured prokaryote]